MSAYYNEIDPYAAAWLRNLIAGGMIAPGEVDERSIADVSPDDVRGFVQCHWFAGIGGWSRSLRLAGWPDDRPVWTGSCPCQPFSAAGKQKGFDDDRHLWPIFAGLIRERQPATVFGEQVAAAAEWLSLVRGDLEAMGYAVGAIPIEAASAGAFHLRDRFWFVANRAGEQVGPAGQPRQRGDVEHDPRVGRGEGRPEPELWSGRPASAGAGREHVAHGNDTRLERLSRHGQVGGQSGRLASQPNGSDDDASIEWRVGADGKARPVKSRVRLLAHGLSGRMALVRAGQDGREETHHYSRIGALRGFGNAIDPRPATAFVQAAMVGSP